LAVGHAVLGLALEALIILDNVVLKVVAVVGDEVACIAK
jgi:hypothetical protein